MGDSLEPMKMVLENLSISIHCQRCEQNHSAKIKINLELSYDFMICWAISRPSEPWEIMAVNIIIIRKGREERGQDLNSKHPAFSQRDSIYHRPSNWFWLWLNFGHTLHIANKYKYTCAHQTKIKMSWSNTCPYCEWYTLIFLGVA